ncbi:MAG: glutamate mutase L [Anaerolineales bacterium]|nr:MAG: glutamate mutase L [Anaerolineales bacterium]
MPTSLVDADSLLAIDVGSVTTRAFMFDVVDGRYRFLAAGSAATTANAPFSDVGEGIREALENLQVITGKVLVGGDERLIIPSTLDGSGVDMVAATISAGPPLKVVLVGLLEDVSLESARHLASTTYVRVVETLSLNDRKKTETRIDSILRLRPDLVLMTGGTDGGASQSVLKLLEAVGLANYWLPQENRFEVLYAGNQQLEDEVRATFGRLGPLHIAPNVQPELGVERLEGAKVQLADIFRIIRSRQLTGVRELDNWSGGGLLPTATSFGRVIRFLSQVYDSAKGVLGVDIGASATTLAAGFAGQLVQAVYPHLGLGHGATGILHQATVSEIKRWLHVDLAEDDIRHYIYNKALYPNGVPETHEDLAIEQVMARMAMRLALRGSSPNFPPQNLRYGPEFLPHFEPIVATGSVLTRAPNLGQTVLMLLDGLQPTGVTTLVLDQNHISPALGVTAAVNPLLAAQILESNTFQNLGTIISPIGDAKPGTPVLRVRMSIEGGSETTVDVKQGSIEVLKFPQGQEAQLSLTPLQRYDIGMGGPGRGGRLRVRGGALGVIIDARGRPITMPGDPVRRRELIAKWRWVLGC